MTTSVFPAFRTSDADRFAAYLVAAGFTEALTIPGARPGEVSHAEYAHGDSGGVMFGSVRSTDDPMSATVGAQSIYVVLAGDAAVDALHATLITHPGVRETRRLQSPDYGGREFGVTDPDGNQWSFGSYAGAV